GIAAEETDHGRHVVLSGDSGHVGGRLDSQDRNSASDEILEEVSIVTSELDDMAVSAEVESRNDHARVRLGVAQPAGGIRREVGVFVEDSLWSDVLLDLDKEAAAADVCMQRVEGLHFVELWRGEKTLA